MNLEKLSKALIHKVVAKQYRQTGIFIESASYTIGMLAGPLFGLVSY